MTFVDGLGLAGYLAGALYFILAIFKNPKVNKLLMIYAILLMPPRILVFKESRIQEKLNKVHLTKPIYSDCDLIPSWRHKEISECINRNYTEEIKVKSEYDNSIRLAQELNISDYSLIFTLLILSAVLPIAIFFYNSDIEQNSKIKDSKLDSFKSMIFQKIPKEVIMEKLNISKSTYYDWHKKYYLENKND
jgi:cytochrome c oxidase subunit IV